MLFLSILVETNVTNMFNTEVLLEEGLNLIEDLMIIDSKSVSDSQMLIPDNKAEIIIPFKQGMKIKPVGHSRDILLDHHTGYFLMPRGRGLELKYCSEGIECLLVKVNPIYAKRIATSFVEISNGIHKMHQDPSMIENLRFAHANKNPIGLHELIIDLIDVSISEFESVSTTILDSIERIKYASGSITIKEIYSALCVSKSKLEQHFNREIGLTPKEFCKIEKINYFIRSYQESEGKSLTELTYECGYYDQSHLIKDFRYFLEMSPKQFFNSFS